MDTAHKADSNPILIRSAEPEDAARIAALLGQPGVAEPAASESDVLYGMTHVRAAFREA